MGQTNPDISCVMTCFNEGSLVAKSVGSILAQTHENFELVLVSDGADEATLGALEAFDDPRIRLIRQANDGLSSARNRGIAHASGDILCFLDADDTRAPSAFAYAVDALGRNNCDVMLTTGYLRELRFQNQPFYDQQVFAEICSEQPEVLCNQENHPSLMERLCLIEPQSANKFIRREFLMKTNLRFPPGLFFEDMYFHAGLVALADNILISNQKTFTYFRRYRRDQITSGLGKTRFDALSVAAATLTRFESSRVFHSGLTRTLLLLALAKLVRWSSQTLSHEYRPAFILSWQSLLSTISGLYFSQLSTDPVNMYGSRYEWMEDARSFILDHKK